MIVSVRVYGYFLNMDPHPPPSEFDWTNAPIPTDYRIGIHYPFVIGTMRRTVISIGGYIFVSSYCGSYVVVVQNPSHWS
jgi:hypothetical protein